MRIVSLIIKALIFIGILAGGSFLIAREVFLLQGVSRLENSVKKTKELTGAPSQYYDQCKKKGNARGTLSQTAFQLRFTSSTEYQVEVVCPQFPSDPIIIKKEILPRFVTKVPGSSGFIWEEYNTHSVSLQIFGRNQTVYTEFGGVKNTIGVTPLDPGPITTCGGLGYQCCQAETTMGQGELVSRVSDCRKSCYASCQARPVVLSFNTDPYLDIKTRTTHLAKGEDIMFSWVAEAGEGLTVSGTIDFGDGQTQNFVDLMGSLSHSYSCAELSCYFKAQISITDELGVESANTGITGIGVRIK